MATRAGRCGATRCAPTSTRGRTTSRRRPSATSSASSPALPGAGGDHDVATKGRWYFFISEKIVAITQGRSYFIWDIKVSRPARILSRYVTRTPAGIGLGSPFTMQLAIEEAGLPRVLYASAGGAIGKLIGKRGLFYELVGGDIRAIDGPTEYSVYPANVSAKLAPKDPDAVARACRR